MDVPSDLSDRVSSLLFEVGCSGIQVEDADTVWKARLTAFFETAAERERVARLVRTALHDGFEAGDLALHEQTIADEDWTLAWREHFEPEQVTDRLRVRAPWHEQGEGIDLVIEPRTAFGTGRHPTTRMALLALEALVERGQRILDVGTGSGILSIAARKLGAREAVALDVDPLAESNVAENLRLNGVDRVVYRTRTVEAGDTGFDIVVANIISSILIPMLGRLAAAVRPGGHVVLGGLLDREEARMKAAVGNAGLVVDSVDRQAEWIGIRAKRPEG